MQILKDRLLLSAKIEEQSTKEIKRFIYLGDGLVVESLCRGNDI